MPITRRNFLTHTSLGAGLGVGLGLTWPISVFAMPIPARATQLHAGPMAGYPAQRSASIWLQTLGPAEVKVAYWPENQPRLREFSEPSVTSARRFYTALITLDNLVPGTTYHTEIHLDGKVMNSQNFQVRTPAIWQWRHPAPDFKILTGSCAYINDPQYDRPGKAYGGGYGIYDPMTAEAADMMIWLGDNLYFREADIQSPAGMAVRYWTDRAFPPLQKFLQSTRQIAIWDDHDYAANDSDSSFVLKESALRLFENYWANPAYGLPGTPGVFTQCTLNDADFFLLDDRWYRDADAAPLSRGKQMFGKLQMDWLKNALLSSRAHFKIIAAGGQLFNDDDAYEGWNLYPEERQDFMDWLQNNAIKGLLFLSGDRHISELMRRTRPRYSGKHDYPLWELTSSPLNSSPARGDANPYRVPGTLVEARNYCSIAFLGKGRDRHLLLSCKSTAGKVLWEHQISSAELGYT
ncbi:alkaline phosphatase D family protein [Acidithiobacillus montserratensis]|uniref:Alkaline phosphatase D family protein n=1 Tax=Acidithiobacillus montserratensis TaxID=2729135 RepID=A0ACD5HHB1_9PROT|nr:alkaline phosphatase D family protein [Acidithiobacillus montserratensis]MBN2680035.1 alkaline phosphatase family protein [Acidithiobacillaceae bacterium]MBU2749372.1 alkaline phosphatase family protein [Acidithiobacillus montserratensis]